ncbi:hypothetical protein ACUY3K_05990 [Corynebacterium uberis]|uniref:hypothetical protein n=1 Tax=Corynebacterium TaxID=1716 RepID=UPI001D0A56E4|nr:MULTISPECIES: hypothetical protein [Corynebacterium]MCZ9308243.1 hypothetical protein [Corynebacterium sp. c6VSa_13]UDL73923.1 hypothetical protein LH391_01460 [Corynebacterium uberis]UDL75194.1 hypothetical protein LH393_07955 [Corynebacterium uberis]UDL77405.1 hypothetical protein LH394_07935 [Corynebacterium uberis]UDL79690.1 hypothetical protein LH392_08360 [Corynebacterium uberis]
MTSSDDKWYFQPSTGEVTQGPATGFEDRMGPYNTREEAAAALETAAQRNKEFDDQDEAWES